MSKQTTPLLFSSKVEWKHSLVEVGPEGPKEFRVPKKMKDADELSGALLTEFVQQLQKQSKEMTGFFDIQNRAFIDETVSEKEGKLAPMLDESELIECDLKFQVEQLQFAGIHKDTLRLIFRGTSKVN